MMRVLTPREMQALDALAEQRGINPLVLMERAGRAVAEQARDLLSSCLEKRVTALCGKGKNGGDGLVAARYLAEWGALVEVFLLGEPEELHPDARANLRKLEEAGLEWRGYDAEALRGSLQRADLAVDALFGIGFHGRADGVHGECIEMLNESGRPVLAVDIPSGVDGLTGSVDGPAVKACRTVAFAYPKTGLYLFPGAALVGEMVVRDIGIPHGLVEEVAVSRIHAIDHDVERGYPDRPPDAHKGSCGKVLLLAGSTGLTGAAALAARAVLRSGAGVATLGVAQSLNPILEMKLTEVMTMPLPEDPPGHLCEAGLPEVLRALERHDVLALGPGLGTREETVSLVKALLREAEKPLVLDADGINCLAGDIRPLAERAAPTVITPHPGELAGLMGSSVGEIQRDRLGAVGSAASRLGCVVVLKGAHTLVADADGRIGINTSGHAGMATAGSGDVLTGCVSTFLAQGMAPFEAACSAVYLHGKAGELAAHIGGEVGMLAGDILSCLPLARSRRR
jgi:hydroxyethylthiazole kinase-like uncharacterized protein yjeF